MGKMMTLACRSGAYDCHTPPSAQPYLLPSVSERLTALKSELKACEERRLLLKNHPDRFTEIMMMQEYRKLGDRIFILQTQLRELKKEFKQQTNESFETMFVRAAKNTLLPEEFDRLKRYAFQLLNEFRENTHLETV
jgi:hypothetical protein